MTFEIQQAKSESFDNLEALLKFVDEEEESIFRLPLKSFVEQGASGVI